MAGAGFWTILAVIVCGMLMVMINSQWYLLVRTLIVRSLFWWLLPVAVYAALILPFFLGSDNLMEPFEKFLYTFSSAPVLWLLAIGLLAVLAVLLVINRNVQFDFIYQEITREEKKPAAIKHVTQFTFLERFGQNGEYLKLELKSIMRN